MAVVHDEEPLALPPPPLVLTEPRAPRRRSAPADAALVRACSAVLRANGRAGALTAEQVEEQLARAGRRVR
jgi:hypothetical protein